MLLENKLLHVLIRVDLILLILLATDLMRFEVLLGSVCTATYPQAT